MIVLINGYCEDFCYNSTCSELNGNFLSECNECPKNYKCSTSIF